MDVHIGDFTSDVRPVDDRTLLTPEVLDQVAEAVARRLEARRTTEERRDEEAQLWGSVRSGTGR